MLVVAESNRGWVLDGICRDTAEHLTIDHQVCYVPGDLPRARAYFFSHWSLALDARKKYRLPRSSRVLAYYTHPRDVGLREGDLIRALNRCDAILSMSSLHASRLVESGVRADRITTVLGAADPRLFRPGPQRGDCVGLVSAYYERKQPELVLRLVRALPKRQFLLVGKGWENAPEWAELRSLPNFEVVTPGYVDYPDCYRRMAVFVSPSSLEGGPIPLLEAMLTGVTPIATRTGFAEDIVEHGRTGYLCDADVEGEQLAVLVEEAFASPGRRVRESVEHLTWRRYARLLTEAAVSDR